VTGRRIGALLLAVGLVAGALLLRTRVLDDDVVTDATDSAASTTASATAAGQLLCITELAAVCRALDLAGLRVDVQDAGATLDALVALPDDAPRPLWLTIQPYPAMVDALRAAAGREPLGGAPTPIASSQLAIATTPARSTDLAAGCVDQALWACIGANAGGDWTTIAPDAASGRIRPSVGDADRQAVALASFADAVAGYFGRADIRASDWQGDPAFTPWVSRLLGQVDTSALSGGTPLATMANRPSLLDIAATTDAELAGVGRDRFAANYPEPSMWVEVVLAVPDGTAAPDELTAALPGELTAAGWADPDAAAQSLPGPTTMLALRTLWQESTS